MTHPMQLVSELAQGGAFSSGVQGSSDELIQWITVPSEANSIRLCEQRKEPWGGTEKDKTEHEFKCSFVCVPVCLH